VAFRFILGFVVDGRGRVYAGEPNRGDITVLDADGKLEGRIGTEGEGPGEFRSVDILGFIRDTLVAVDLRLARATYVNDKGDVLRTHSITIPAGVRYRPLAFLDGGRIAALPFAGVLADLSEGKGLPVLVLGAGGAVLDTLVWIRAGNTPGGRVRIGNVNSGFQQPFNDNSLWAAASGGEGLVVVDRPFQADKRGVFRVKRFGPRGDVVYDRPFAYEPRPVSDAAIDEAVGRIVTISRSVPSPIREMPLSTVRQAYRSAIRVPPHEPAVSEVMLDEKGEVWLRRENRGDSGIWEVLAGDGHLRVRVIAPARTRRLVTRAGFIWGIEVDENDVENLVRYELVK
jgi:hypothetical protein